MGISIARGSAPDKEAATMRRLEGFGRLDFLQATYRTHNFPPHVHDTFVIELVEQGIDEFTVGSNLHRAHAGEIILIHPGEVHNGHPAGEAPLSYRAIYPRPELLTEVARSIGHPTGAVPTFAGPVLQDPLLADRLIQLFRALEEPADPARSDAILHMALTTLVRRHGKGSTDSQRPKAKRPAVRRVVDYIRAHASEPLSLEELSGIARLSLYHFLRVFRKEVGLRPHEFLVNIRVDRARGLLSRGRSITEAAVETGFADQSHLTRWFKRIMGITPGNFRA